MKILYFKNKVIYISLLIAIILIILTITIYDIYSSNTPNIEIQYADENNICDDECDEINQEKERKNMLIEKYKEKKLLALTFDDGPGKYTNTLIDELKKRNVPVTFFLIGENAEKWPSTVKFEIDAGNEVGIHSYHHTLFTKLTDTQINEQIAKTKFIILNETNVEVSLIRVPYGSINDRVESVLDENKLTSILWTVDSRDWKFRNTDKTYNYVLKNIKGNDIILMHDIYKTSVTAAIKLVDKLLSECYTFVTVSELLEIEKLAKN